MDSSNSQNGVHDRHEMRGPHFGDRLTTEQREQVLQWLEATEDDPELGIHELAEFVAGSPPLERAVLGAVASAFMGGAAPSSTRHAVALLGLRRTRSMIRLLAAADARRVRTVAASQHDRARQL